jgi:hypothetical protein
MVPSQFLVEADQSCLSVIGRIPWSYTQALKVKDGGSGTAPRHAERRLPSEGIAGTPLEFVQTKDGKWRLGQRVFSDEWGYGEIIAIRPGETGEVLRVRFETGGERSITAKSAANRIESVADA